MNRAAWLLIAAVLCVLAAAAHNDKPVLIMGGEPTVQMLPAVSRPVVRHFSTPMTMQ